MRRSPAEGAALLLMIAGSVGVGRKIGLDIVETISDRPPDPDPTWPPPVTAHVLKLGGGNTQHLSDVGGP
jgi:hypothetical protein